MRIKDMNWTDDREVYQLADGKTPLYRQDGKEGTLFIRCDKVTTDQVQLVAALQGRIVLEDPSSLLLKRLKANGNQPVTLFVDGDPYPVHLDAQGTLRFVGNRIVRSLLNDTTRRMTIDMNTLVVHTMQGVYTKAELTQLDILTGYSVSGFMELNNNRDVVFSVEREADGPLAELRP